MTIYPHDMARSAIELACTTCGAARRLDGMDVIRETSPYHALDIALLFLSRGCEGRGGVCCLRFTNVAGAGAVRSIGNRRGSGWTRRRKGHGSVGWRIYWDGWHVALVTQIPHGPSQGLWQWGTGTQPIRNATKESEAAALAAVKAAVMFGADGLPDTTEVGKLRRASRGWQRKGLSIDGPDGDLPSVRLDDVTSNK